MHRAFALVALLVTTLSLLAQDKPVPTDKAAAKMTLPPNFHAILFAGEPDVVQPIAFCFDDRGRLWVAENHSYPNWEADPKKGKDRVVIFEEGDNGAFSKRTVFADNLQNLSGINYGFGGIWLCSTPNLVFIPIKEVPDKKVKEESVGTVGWVERTREAHQSRAELCTEPGAGGPREYARPTLHMQPAQPVPTKTVPAGPPEI